MLRKLFGDTKQESGVPLQTFTVEKKQVSTTLIPAEKVAAYHAKPLQYVAASTIFMPDIPSTPIERMVAFDEKRRSLEQQFEALLIKHFPNSALLRKWRYHLKKIDDMEILAYEGGFLLHKENLDAFKPYADIQKVMREYLAILDNPKYQAYLNTQSERQTLRRF